MKISKVFDTIVALAREEAMRTGSYSIGADHLLLGILRHSDNEAVRIMRSAGIDTAACKADIDSVIFHEHSIPYGQEDEVRLSSDGGSVVNAAIAEAMAEGAPEAGAEHLLKAICKTEGILSGDYLRSKGLCASSFSGKCKPGKQAREFVIGEKEISVMLSTLGRINNSIPS
jgi:ATP-dependent Clp protease ATP-binding subunit ClpC